MLSAMNSRYHDSGILALGFSVAVSLEGVIRIFGGPRRRIAPHVSHAPGLWGACRSVDCGLLVSQGDVAASDCPRAWAHRPDRVRLPRVALKISRSAAQRGLAAPPRQS